MHFCRIGLAALVPFWYPVAFSREVTDLPFATRLLDERVVLYRISDGSVVAARDICYHRGVRSVWATSRATRSFVSITACATTHPAGAPASRSSQWAISPRLRLDIYSAQERYGLVWVRLVDNGPLPLPEMNEWKIPTTFPCSLTAWQSRLLQVGRSRGFSMSAISPRP